VDARRQRRPCSGAEARNEPITETAQSVRERHRNVTRRWSGSPGIGSIHGAPLAATRRQKRRTSAGGARLSRRNAALSIVVEAAEFRGNASPPEASAPPSTAGAHRAAPLRRGGRGCEEDRCRVGPPEADEQPPFGPVPRSERIDSPVDDPHAARRMVPGEEPFGVLAQLRAAARRDPQVPGAHEGLRLGPSFERPPDRGGWVAPGPLGIRRHRDDAGGARTNLPAAGERARNGAGADGLVAVAIAPAARRRQCGPEEAGERTAARQFPAPATTRFSQSLAKRSRHARAVRGTCSENPVRRCCTRPSDHSRNTCGIR